MTEGLPECTGSNGHDWKTLMAHAKGRGHGFTEVQELCRGCGIIRFNPNREVYVPEHDGDGYRRPHDHGAVGEEL